MKILQTVFQMMDYGGIVNYTELLAQGLAAKGHTVDTVILRNSASAPYVKKPDTVVVGAYKSRLHDATLAHAAYGWYGMRVYSYGSVEQRKIWRTLANGYDAIIHQVPVPEADAKGNWRKVFQVHPTQVLIAHDAHFPHLYPHMLDILPMITGISTTHPAGYMALSGAPVPRCFIGGPHVLRPWKKQVPWDQRAKLFASAHVWKAWKHMDKVLRALPILMRTSSVENWIAGDGIEARYMRSVDKCKPKYAGIWKAAMKAGMHYDGMVSPLRSYQMHATARVMVDLSYSKAFEQYGNHYNRSLFEAFNAGCVPLVTHENMREPKGLPHLFSAGDTHMEIAQDATPEEVANAIRTICEMSPKRARTIIETGRELLLKHWSVERVTQYTLDMIAGKKTLGIYQRHAVGKVTPELLAARNVHIAKAEATR